MFRDRLQSLRKRAKRWGLKRHRVTRGDSRTVSTATSCADRSDELLRALRRVDVIRADIQHITNELPAVWAAQQGLLVAVDVQDCRLGLQARLENLCDRANTAQLLLSSLNSSSQAELPDSALVKILETQLMVLSRSLLEVVKQLWECEEELSTIVKKRQCRSHSLGVIIDCTVSSLSIQRCKSQLSLKTASCPQVPEKVRRIVFDSISQEDEVASVESQLSQIQQVSLILAELVSVQNDLIDNIEHNVQVPHLFKY